MDQTGNFGILLGDAFVGIDEDQAHICPVDGADGAHIGVFLNGIVHLALPAHTGGVDEAVFAGFVFIVGVDGIPGGSGHIGNNDPLFAQNPV